jgi:hypothetical protein
MELAADSDSLAFYTIPDTRNPMKMTEATYLRIRSHGGAQSAGFP